MISIKSFDYIRIYQQIFKRIYGDMQALWEASEALEATNGEVHYSDKWHADGVSIDSRTVCPGDLFIALIGENTDGHKYLDNAVKSGAAAAIVSYIPENFTADFPLIIVKDSFEALYNLAKYSRERTKAKIIGVTGSVGKTSVKEMLKAAFSTQGTVYATEGNLNNHYGVPLSLSRMHKECDFGIFEMGMSAPGEISPLSVLAQPDVAIISTIEPVHLEFFDSVEGIADAKAEIFDGLNENGTAIINRDSFYYLRLLNKATDAHIKHILSFGLSSQADFQLIHHEENDNGGIVTANCNGIERKYQLGICGTHQAKNSLAVLAAVQALGENVQKAAEALGKLTPPKGRGKKHTATPNKNGKKVTVTVIDDSYNASPASVKAALEQLEKSKTNGKHKRSIAILGDMYELGDTASDFHEALSEDIMNHHIDGVMTIGDLMHNLYKKLPEEKRIGHFKDSDAATNEIISFIKTGDILLVKGSRGVRTDKIVNKLLEI